jgi:hypothetical protein
MVIGLLSFGLFSSLFSNAQKARSAVVDHGRLGKWITSSRAAVDADDDDQVPILERPGDPPAGDPWISRPTAAPSKANFGKFYSVQVNVNQEGFNIIGDAANEPSITMDPTNPTHLEVGWRQFDSVSSNFRQAGDAYSDDGGATWQNQEILNSGVFRSDPVLAPLGKGNVYYLSLLETFYDSVFGSENSGETYSLLQESATGGDKQWFTIDNSTGPGRGNMYQSWSTAGNNWDYRQFSRSTDGGHTWENPIYLPSYPIWGTLDVDNSGTLYIGGLADTTDTYFACLRSKSAKFRGESVSFDQVSTVNLGGALVYGSYINPDGLSGQTFLAVDKSFGPTSGNVYMLASVGVSDQRPLDVEFARSVDQGVIWSHPLRVNNDAINPGVVHWFGTIGVAPTGRIDVIWLDNRYAPNTTLSSLFYRGSYDGGLTWTPEERLSPQFDASVGYPNQNKMGDYMTVISDANGANVAYTATFNKEEDIWFLRVPAPARTSTANPQAVSERRP